MNPTAAAANSNITGHSEPNTVTSRIPPIIFVGDEELEEQFLTGDEVSQEVMDVMANQVMTAVDNNTAPMNAIYMQQSQQDEELDLRPSRRS